MTEISSEMVKELRTITSAGMMDCKRALAESGGNMEKAVEYLRKKGLKDISKRADRSAQQGVVHSYIHAGDRIGVLIELNCETDFVARCETFQELAHAVAMHVAWASPRFLNRESVPEAVLEKEKEIALSQLKPEQQKMAERIVQGKMEKFYADNCLLEQIDVRDPAAKKSIGEIINETSAKVGEKLVLRRYVRFELGEAVDSA